MSDASGESGTGLLAERVIGAIVLVFGSAVAFWLVPTYTDPTPGAALPARAMPTIAALGIGACGLMQLLRPIAASVPMLQLASGATTAIVICIATWVGLAFAGFAPTAPVLALALMTFMGERRPAWLAAGGLGLPAVIWVMFEVVLRRPLP